MSTGRRGPAWGKDVATQPPLYPTHLLNEMEHYMRSPMGLLPSNLVADADKEADRLLLAYLRRNVPLLIEALRKANAA